MYLNGQVENCITLHAPLHTAIRHDRTQTLSSCAKPMLCLPTFKIIIYIIASILFLCKNAVKKSRGSIFFITNNFERGLQSRAGRYISCDMHAHIVSKADSLISGKLRHLFSNEAEFNTQSRKSLASYAISLSLSQMNRIQNIYIYIYIKT